MCLKKYCECFQAGVSCSNTCACLNCYNTNKPGLGGDLVAAQPRAAGDKGSKGSAIAAPAVGTPQSEGEDGIERAAEYLALLQKGREESAKKAAALQRAVKSEGVGAGTASSDSASRPPLPGTSGKRKRDSAGSDEGRRSLSFTPVPSGDKQRGCSAVAASPGIPVFSLRSASPNSMHIASALSLLSGKSYCPNVQKQTPYDAAKTLDRAGLKIVRANSSASDATTSEDDSQYGGPSPASPDLERKDSMDCSSSSDAEVPEVPEKQWGGKGLAVRGVAIGP